MVLRKSARKGFACIWQSKWFGVIGIEIERTQIHFLGDVFVAVAVVIKIPYFNWKWTFFILQRYFCQNFWSNRLYNKKETKKYKFGSVKVRFKMKKTSVPVSLRSKRFRLASEQRGPRKGSFGFDHARNETRAKKWERLFYLRHFSRDLWLSFLVLSS